jgi:hypothetical protein
MRAFTAQAGYLIMVFVVLGTAWAAVAHLYENNAKPTRHWNAEIDRIVAHQQEKKRMAALAVRLERIEPLNLASAATEAGAEPAAARPVAAETNAHLQVAQKKAQTTAQTRKKPSRRNGHGRRQFVPATFVELPKFAVATAASALRMR